jgi:hypothetical protein
MNPPQLGSASDNVPKPAQQPQDPGQNNASLTNTQATLAPPSLHGPLPGVSLLGQLKRAANLVSKTAPVINAFQSGMKPRISMSGRVNVRMEQKNDNYAFHDSEYIRSC